MSSRLDACRGFWLEADLCFCGEGWTTGDTLLFFFSFFLLLSLRDAALKKMICWAHARQRGQNTENNPCYLVPLLIPQTCSVSTAIILIMQIPPDSVITARYSRLREHSYNSTCWTLTLSTSKSTPCGQSAAESQWPERRPPTSRISGGGRRRRKC